MKSVHFVILTLYFSCLLGPLAVFLVIANSTATPFPVSAHFPKGQHLLGVIHTELCAALYRQIPMQTSIDCDSDF